MIDEKQMWGGWPGSPGDPRAASFHPWRLPEGLVQDWHTARRSLVELILLAIVLLIGHQLPTRLGRRSCVCPTRLHLSGGVTLRLHAVPRSHRERVGHMGGADTHRRVLLHRTRPGVLRESNTRRLRRRMRGRLLRRVHALLLVPPAAPRLPEPCRRLRTAPLRLHVSPLRGLLRGGDLAVAGPAVGPRNHELLHAPRLARRCGSRLLQHGRVRDHGRR